MRRPISRLRSLPFVCLLAMALPALAYTPGSGTIYSTNFETIDADWENGNNVADSPWTQIQDGTDKSFYADGKGSVPSSPTRHRAKHFVHPVNSTSFSVAFEYRAELGATYLFDLTTQQRAPQLKAYKLRIDGNGALSLWRSEAGVMVQKVNTSNGVIPVNVKRWIRFAIEPDSGSGQFVRVRVWGGSASSEPTSWTLSYQDPSKTLERVHRLEIFADGPKNIETWIDDLDAYGDGSVGVPSSITKIYLVEWSHLDVGFTEPPDTIETFAKTHLDEVLLNLAADPDYRWTIESAWWLDRWWERSTEPQRQNMLSWLRSGRLKLTAGYTNLHTTVAGHEELTRNLYYASRFARQNQIPLRTWITDDVPGSTFALPELLKRSGVEFFVGGMNTPFGGAVREPNHATRPFYWQGPDGSKTLSWITFDAYAEAFNWGFSFFDTLADTWRNTGREIQKQEEAGYPYPEIMLFRAFDNHYQGFKTRDLVDQWNSTYQTPVFVLSTVEEFMDHMKSTYGANSFPTYSGDFGAAWSGSHAAEQNTTTMVRQSHRDGRAAEAMLAAAWAAGGDPVPQTDVDFMYRRQLEVDEHSGAGGWPGYFTPEEMDRNNRIHLGWAADARNKAVELAAMGDQRITANVPAQGDAIVAINPLGRARDGWVRKQLPAALYGSSFKVIDRTTGSELPYQRFSATSEILFRATALPAVGYRVYDLVAGTPSASSSGILTVAGNTLENDFYTLTVDPLDGSVASLIEKATGRQLIDPAAGYRFNRMANNVTNDINASNNPIEQPVASATVTIEASGSQMVGLKVTRTGTPHTQTLYRLYRGEDRVEIVNTFDKGQTPYVSNATGTRAYFVTLPFDVANFELRTETTTRFLDARRDGFPRDNTFDWHNTEHSIHFWDSGGGISYACDTVNSHYFEKLKALGGTTLSVSKGMLLPRLFDRTDEYQFADNSIGPYQMEPDAPTVFSYTHHFRATPANWDPVAASRFGFEALNAPRAVLLAARSGSLPSDKASFVSIDAPSVLLYTVKAADDGDGLILRMTELTGATNTVAHLSSDLLPFSSALKTEQDEEGGTALTVSGGVVDVPIGPYETATVRVRIQPVGNATLAVTKDGLAGTVKLQWTGGGPNYTLRRAENPQFTLGVTTLTSGPGSSLDDPVLNDGISYFYLVD
ncbi:MAG: hypothetical protein U0V87_04405 [Acidobacteriota bacterium]